MAGSLGMAAEDIGSSLDETTEGLPLPDPGLAGTELWEAWTGYENREEWARDVTVSPLGDVVYVTGNTIYRSTWAYSSWMETVAYDAESGEELWRSTFKGEKSGAIAYYVTTDGDRVYVGGRSWHAESARTDITVVAYEADTGEELWSARPPTETRSKDLSGVVTDGERVFISGNSYTYDSETSSTFTAAFDAVTGNIEWISRFSHDELDSDSTGLIETCGGKVFVGVIMSLGPWWDQEKFMTTFAYDAGTGAELWASHHDGGHGDWLPSNSYFLGIATSMDCSNIFVVGQTLSPPVPTPGSIYPVRYRHMDTVAIDAETGSTVWWNRTGEEGTHTYTGPVATDGVNVYTTVNQGFWAGSPITKTVAHNALTGEKQWEVNETGPARGASCSRCDSVVTSNGNVVVTGENQGDDGRNKFTVTAYNGLTGTRMWKSQKGEGEVHEERAAAIAVDPLGLKVYVTGSLWDPERKYEYVTASYLP